MSLTFRRAAFLCVTAVGAVLATVAPGNIANAAKAAIGTLTCEIEGGKSFIFGSTKDLHCVFRRYKGPSQAYSGRIKKFGIDIGVTGPSTLVWTVIASTRAPTPAELAGKYVGVAAGAAVGIGGEANVLVGGSNKTISLQPLSVVGETGIDITGAVASLTLNPLFVPPPSVTVAAIIPNYGCGSYVVVTPGETLANIAGACRVTVDALLRANPEIKNVRELRVGERIALPIFSGKFGTPPCGTKAILKPGETIVQLADRCGVTLHGLVVANRNTRNLADLKPGVVLNIPPF
jgi:LysM repeat protein